jgi:hypothetical protein
MRYWVYKDAQILGPLAREDLAQGRLRADTLVCGEDASGERDMDWRCAEEVPELSGLYLTGEAPPSILDRGGFEDSLLERLQFEAIGTETGASQGEWLSGVFAPAALRADTHDIAAELAVSRKRVQELTAKLESLTRLPQPDTLPGTPEAAAPQAPTPASVPEPPKEAPEQEVSKHNVLKLPDQNPKQGVKLGAPKSFLSVRKKAPPPAEALPETPVPQSLPEPVSSEPPKAAAPESLEAPGSKRNILKLSGQTPKKGVKLGATKSFVSVRKEITQPPAQVVTPAPSPVPILTPFPTPVPTPAPVSMAPAPSTEVPRAAEPPPMPTFQPMAAAAEQSLEPPPIPTMAPFSVTAPPATMAYSGFFSSQPSPAAAPQPAPGPAAVSATDEALVRLAKPQAAPASATLEPKPKRGEKTFLIISALLVVSLVVAGLMFFSDSKSIKSAVNMGDDQEPLGTATVEGEGASSPEPSPEPALSPAPAPPPAEPFPQAATPTEPTPEEVPAAAPIVTVQDERPAAIGLVKGFPLDGDRGTVGRWLQYSFTASPGFNEKWDAGAVEGSTYLVQYTVQDSGKSMRPAITYLFEADVARRTVRGKNPAAREMLSGSQAPVKTVRKPRARRAAPTPAATPKQPPLLPLPSDTDLLPPSEEGASFHSDMVQPGL